MASSERPRDERPEVPRSAPYLDPYREAVDRFGPSFEATLWANERYQSIRFQTFTGLFDFTDATIIDAGSGDGAFARALHEMGIRFRRYTGLEAMPEMVERARSMAPPNAEFRVCDFATDPSAFVIDGSAVDAVVFSGSLNTFTPALARQTLGRAWDAGPGALLFNFLSSRTHKARAGGDTGPAHRFDPLELLDWALEKTPSVAFRQDYLKGHDATIAMFRDEPQG
ncbi:MAG: class I SAM-dependent methyltransferase [Phycisphaeraceae bacterium]|nr:class I SAM-dependent methyltransferase [Phycisphaeraceae bacterium]